MKNNIPFARRGESDAAEYGVAHGFEVLERNYRIPGGEIDLVLRRSDGMIVFAEVKTRSGEQYGTPEEAITARKMAFLRRAAGHYMRAHYPAEDTAWRIDVAALDYSPDRKTLLELRWYEDVGNEF